MNVNWGLVRIAGAALVVLLAFAAGWVERGWRADAAIAELKKANSEERISRMEAARRAVEKAEEDGRAASGQLASQIRDINLASQKLRTEIRDAESRAYKSGAASCRMSGEWVRLYNEALRPAGGPNPPTGEPAGATKGAGDAGNGPASTTEWDVEWVHAENSARWAECRAQLNSLIDFVLGDGKNVVTP